MRLESDLEFFQSINFAADSEVFGEDLLKKIEFLAHRVAGLAGALGSENLGVIASSLDRISQVQLEVGEGTDGNLEIQGLVGAYIEACKEEISKK